MSQDRRRDEQIGTVTPRGVVPLLVGGLSLGCGARGECLGPGGACGAEVSVGEVESSDVLRELVESMSHDEGGGAVDVGLLEQELHQRGTAFGVE